MTLTLAPKTEARLLAVAMEHNMAPEEVVDAALESFVRQELSIPPLQEFRSPEMEAGEQARLHAVMLELIDAGKTLDPDPFDSPHRQAYRDKPIDPIIVEKFRRQGFDL